MRAEDAISNNEVRDNYYQSVKARVAMVINSENALIFIVLQEVNDER